MLVGIDRTEPGKLPSFEMRISRQQGRPYAADRMRLAFFSLRRKRLSRGSSFNNNNRNTTASKGRREHLAHAGQDQPGTPGNPTTRQQRTTCQLSYPPSIFPSFRQTAKLSRGTRTIETSVSISTFASMARDAAAEAATPRAVSTPIAETASSSLRA